MKYTIQDVREGRCAIKNDSTLVELRELLKICFPNERGKANGNQTYYYTVDDLWVGHHFTNLPTQSVKEFYEDKKNEGKREWDNLNKHIEEFEKEQENEFVWGEEVEVSIDNVHWVKCIYGCKNIEASRYISITEDGFMFVYEYIRKLPTKLKITPQMIADKFGVPIDGFEIENFK